jgi:hypothetical protein
MVCGNQRKNGTATASPKLKETGLHDPRPQKFMMMKKIFRFNYLIYRVIKKSVHSIITVKNTQK